MTIVATRFMWTSYEEIPISALVLFPFEKKTYPATPPVPTEGGGGGGPAPVPTTGQIWPRGDKAGVQV